MTSVAYAALVGAVLGGGLGVGLVVVVLRLRTLRRPVLALRVLPFVRDLSPVASALSATAPVDPVRSCRRVTTEGTLRMPTPIDEPA